jgi:uncharacterized protein
MKTRPKLRFEYGKKKDGQFYWHLKAANGQIVAQGEGYKTGASCLKVFALLRDHMAKAEVSFSGRGSRKPWGDGPKPRHYEGKFVQPWPGT